MNGIGPDLSRVNLDGILTAVIIVQFEIPACLRHQLAHLVMADEGRCPAAPVQLIHHTGIVKQGRLQLQLLINTRQVGLRLAAILCRNLVAAAIETHRVTERDMEIQR